MQERVKGKKKEREREGGNKSLMIGKAGQKFVLPSWICFFEAID